MHPNDLNIAHLTSQVFFFYGPLEEKEMVSGGITYHLVCRSDITVFKALF